MLRRFAALGAVAAALLPLAGCGATPTPAATHSSPPAVPAPDPGDVLAAAVTRTTGVNLKVEISDSTGDDFLGSYDGTSHTAALEQAPGGTGLKVTVTPTDYYLGGLRTLKGGTWRLKITKLRDASSQALLTDVLVPMTLLSGASGVQQTAPGRYLGHIDATQVKGATPGEQKFLDHVLKAAGANAQTLVFTATVDEHGYLSGFKTTFPGLAEGKDVVYGLKLSDFGAPVNIVIPSGTKVVDAPDKAYATL